METKECIFCQIAKGEADASIVYQDDAIVAFLDHHPIRPGHTLIIPRTHIAHYEDLSEDIAGKIMRLGQRLGRIMKNLDDVPQVCFLYAGHFPHAHAHVYPMHEEHDVMSRQYIAESNLTFRPPEKISPEDLIKNADRLRSALNKQ